MVAVQGLVRTTDAQWNTRRGEADAQSGFPFPAAGPHAVIEVCGDELPSEFGHELVQEQE